MSDTASPSPSSPPVPSSSAPAAPDRARAGTGSGPVEPGRSAIHVHRPLPHHAVVLDARGFLGEWQRRNATRTIPHVLERIEQGEARGNLARLVEPASELFRGMPFTDSDVYKTLEALAWAAVAPPGQASLDRQLLERGARLVSLLAKAQDDDGYLNSYVQGRADLERWADPQWAHELYTAGHLFQAAVAATRSGVFGELLPVAENLAQLAVAVHGAPSSPYVDGHPQVETALVELYRLTGRASYLELARAQIERRGHGWLGEQQFGSAYFQDHEPLRTAGRATGHAVRQLYLLTGAVDVAVETRDGELLAAVERVWRDLFATKTYVTGAHGSRHRDEAIGDPYELPPDRAYAETCAAIASFQLNWRLLLATGRSCYADAMETVLYNAVAVSTSLDGRHFFYSNPLQLRTDHDGSTEDAPSHRLPWFACACCPPNIARLVASVHDYLATATGAGLTLHHYTRTTITAQSSDGPYRVAVDTDYPYDGTVRIEVLDPATVELTLRIPSWCEDWSLSVDGRPVPASASARDGYVMLSRAWRRGSRIVLTLAMPARVVRAHPYVDAVRGSVAIVRGPLVHAAEQADLPEAVSLDDVEFVRVLGAGDSPAPELAPVAVEVEARVRPAVASTAAALYTATAGDHAAAADGPGGGRGAGTDRLRLRLLPYHRWGNRRPGAMRVWLPDASGSTSA